MKTPEEIKKGLECCAESEGCPEICPYYNEQSCGSKQRFDALAYILQLEEREWDLFDLLSSAWHGKGYYFKQEDGTVYSRASCEYMSFDQAVDEFAHELTVAGEPIGSRVSKIVNKGGDMQ